jgi:hypothetical protein
LLAAASGFFHNPPLFETAQFTATGSCSRPEESSSWEECGLSKTSNRLLKRSRQAVAERVLYEKPTPRPILLRSANLFGTIEAI